MLLLDDQWRIADFGIARDLAEETATYTFAGAGTMLYMAPELWSNRPATVKTDLYALGVVAYEVLTGARPFPGPDEPRFRDQHLHAVPAALPGVPPAVARLVLRMLAKDPASRPQDARAVLEELDSARRRLAPTQNQLREAALAAQHRAADTEARRAAARTAAAAEQDRRTQALADLESILDAADDMIHQAVPDAQAFRAAADRRGFTAAEGIPQSRWVASVHGVGISAAVWGLVLAAEGLGRPDPLVAAGEVRLWRQTAPTGDVSASPMANIVCEEDGTGRIVWSLLRFSASAFVGPNYRLGPLGREHGCDARTFADERFYMVSGGMHIWTRNTYILTADIIVGLLREAIQTQ